MVWFRDSILCVQYVCSDSTSFSSEEFSRVQEESVDKISETSNQPDKTGKTVINHTQINLLLCAVYNAALILSSSVLQNPWMQKKSRPTPPPIR